LTGTIKLADPENPLVGASIGTYLHHKLSYSRFCVENRTFSLPWQQGLRLYLIFNRSYGKFSGKIPNFSLPWQQWSSEQRLTDTIKLAYSENPLAGASIWGVSPAQAALGL